MTRSLLFIIIFFSFFPFHGARYTRRTLLFARPENNGAQVLPRATFLEGTPLSEIDSPSVKNGAVGIIGFCYLGNEKKPQRPFAPRQKKKVQQPQVKLLRNAVRLRCDPRLSRNFIDHFVRNSKSKKFFFYLTQNERKLDEKFYKWHANCSPPRRKRDEL